MRSRTEECVARDHLVRAERRVVVFGRVECAFEFGFQSVEGRRLDGGLVAPDQVSDILTDVFIIAILTHLAGDMFAQRPTHAHVQCHGFHGRLLSHNIEEYSGRIKGGALSGRDEAAVIVRVSAPCYWLGC